MPVVARTVGSSVHLAFQLILTNLDPIITRDKIYESSKQTDIKHSFVFDGCSNEMGGASSTYAYRLLVGNPKGMSHSEDLGVDGWIILKRM